MSDEERLLRRMYALGWMSPALMTDLELAAVDVLRAKGQAMRVVQDRRDVWRLTDAGREAAINLPTNH